MVYLPTFKVDFDGFHVGKYTSPMDPMGNIQRGRPRMMSEVYVEIHQLSNPTMHAKSSNAYHGLRWVIFV